MILAYVQMMKDDIDLRTDEKDDIGLRTDDEG
jgi:hypothetical protein